ncbi:hypothetical protein DFH09DRAFT_1085928 [Mycena vulgaris]|nr:hypothetical protein DFH09DRAFT_1085928 [Mycena vulgaris]
MTVVECRGCHEQPICGGLELSEFRSLNHDEELPQEPSICLFTPYEGCHEIIDSMIQSVASLLNADVVVLDALELALGEFGVLGTDIGRAISDVYEPKRKSDLSRIQAAFNAILTVSNKVQPCTGVDLTEASKRRFIYLRDLGSIARSAKPFMARLLHAIRGRRSAAYENENHSGTCGILHPTVLLMGFDKAFDSCYCCWASPNSWNHSTFSEGGRALRETLPALDTILLKALPAAFFLPLVPKSSKVNTTALSLAQNSVIPALREECICLIPRNFQQKAVRDLTRFAKIKRKIDVRNIISLLTNNLWLVWPCELAGDCRQARKVKAGENTSRKGQNKIVYATRQNRTGHLVRSSTWQQGFLVVEDLNSAMSADTSSGGANPNNALWSDVLGDRPDILLPVAVSRIVTIAIGLAHRRPHAQTPIRIDAEDISKAHAIFIENSRTFSHWVDEVKGLRKASQSDTESSDAEQTSTASEKNSDGASEEDNKDTIVENVKNCKDLNEHEKALLPCIVDCISLTTKFDNVCIDPEIIQSLKDILSFPLKYPAVFKTGILRENRSAVYSCMARLVRVKRWFAASDMVNKWVGESEKLAQNVFNLAHRLAPCIVFFDEIDSMFRSRTSDDRHHTRNTAMGGLQSARKNRDAGIVVVGATNRVCDGTTEFNSTNLTLFKACRSRRRVLRRLPTKLLVKLPDETRRKATEAAKESMMKATTDGTAAHAGRPGVPSRVLGQKHFEHALTQVSPSTTNSSDMDR